MKRRFLLIVASLLFGGMMYAQDYHWADFDYHDYQRPMIVIGQVYFNGEIQNNANIEVASFVGDELRGRSMTFEPYPNSVIAGQYFVYQPCYYNTEGETFTFKAYDHASGLEYDICELELVGQNDGHGSVENPIQFEFIREEDPNSAPSHPWVQTSQYPGEGMVFTAQIQINGEQLDRATWEVGAFCGDECRGQVTPLDDWTDIDLGYFAFMNLLGNDGDVVNFYLYDTESQTDFEGICTTTVVIENGGEMGNDIMGGDIFVLNFVTEQTFILPITGYTANAEIPDHYYLIASPIGTVAPDKVNHLLENNYDFYSFDQDSELEWINIHDGNTNLISGTGYLYANSNNVTLEFTGYPYTGDGKVTLVKDASNNPNKALEGWNLVGNPFAKTAYITKPFYAMNTDGTNVVAETRDSIKAMEGVFVVASSNGEEMTFSTTAPTKNKSQIVLNVVQNRGAVLDRAIVRVGEDEMLPKFVLNENATKVYIPQEGNDYAVVRCGQAGEIPFSFKAEKNGVYTINVSAEELDVNYLHLIDNLTGADVDLLENPNYSFNAQTTDYASRFKLVFATGVNNDDVFGFYSNGNWIINNDGDAVLQVIDVTGRIMSNEEIHGCYSKRIEAAPGVYMLRLVNGSDVKVQKIVVE